MGNYGHFSGDSVQPHLHSNCACDPHRFANVASTVSAVRLCYGRRRGFADRCTPRYGNASAYRNAHPGGWIFCSNGDTRRGRPNQHQSGGNAYTRAYRLRDRSAAAAYAHGYALAAAHRHACPAAHGNARPPAYGYPGIIPHGDFAWAANRHTETPGNRYTETARDCYGCASAAHRHGCSAATNSGAANSGTTNGGAANGCSAAANQPQAADQYAEAYTYAETKVIRLYSGIISAGFLCDAHR